MTATVAAPTGGPVLAELAALLERYPDGDCPAEAVSQLLDEVGGPPCCRHGCRERATALVTGPTRVPKIVVLLLMCSGCSLTASTAMPGVEVRQLPPRRRARSA